MTIANLSQTTEDHYVFYDDNGNKFAVGRYVDEVNKTGERTVEEALDLILNPPPPPPPPSFDTGNGYALDISESAVQQFAQDSSGWLMKLQLHLCDPNDPVVFRDINGTPRQLGVTQYLTMLSNYHTYCRNLWAQQ
jgi:hypothetical protein